MQALTRLMRSMCRRRSLLLAYHGIGASAPGTDPHNLRITPQRFRAQLDLLLDAGFQLVTVAALAEKMDHGPPPPGFATLSFDDGMEDNYSTLLPILREYGVTATIYVTAGTIGEPNPWTDPAAGLRMMTAHELRALAEAGLELGAHTVTHPDLSRLSREACLREMVESRATIERVTGARVQTFAYPFCRYGDAAVAAARDAGFTAAVTCEGRGGWNRFELRRAMITGRDGWPSFALKAADVYQPLFESRPGRAIRGSTRGVRTKARGD